MWAGPVRNSGTPYRQLLEEGFLRPGVFHEVGINSFANSQAYLRYVEDLGVGVHQLAELREKGVGATVRALAEACDAEAVFFGFDLDVVHAGRGAGGERPRPHGPHRQGSLRDRRRGRRGSAHPHRGITEVNPAFDRDGITAKLAANIVMRSLANPCRGLSRAAGYLGPAGSEIED